MISVCCTPVSHLVLKLLGLLLARLVKWEWGNTINFLYLFKGEIELLPYCFLIRLFLDLIDALVALLQMTEGCGGGGGGGDASALGSCFIFLSNFYQWVTISPRMNGSVGSLKSQVKAHLQMFTILWAFWFIYLISDLYPKSLVCNWLHTSSGASASWKSWAIVVLCIYFLPKETARKIL